MEAGDSAEPLEKFYAASRTFLRRGFDCDATAAFIRTLIEKGLSEPVSGHWVFKATVYKRPGSKGFVGYGDADPSNVSPLVRGAEMRVAETEL